MSTLVAAVLAVAIVIGGAVALVAAAGGIIMGFVWVMDRLVERFGSTWMEIVDNAMTLGLVLLLLGICWFAAFYWLMGW